MKQSGICPKCGKDQIISVSTSPWRNDNQKIYGPSTLPPCQITYYVCSACGFVEEWVDPDEFKRSGIAEYWQKKQQKNLEFDALDNYWRQKLKENKSDQ